MKRTYKITACLVALALCLTYLPLFATAETVTFKQINVIESEDFSAATDKLTNASNITDGALTVEKDKDVQVADKWWPEGNKPTKISFDLTNASGTGYFFLTDKNGNAVGNTVRNNDGGLFATKATMTDGTVKEIGGGWGNKFCGCFWVPQDNSVYAELEPFKKAHYEYEFTYNGTKVTIKLKINGELKYQSGDIMKLSSTSTQIALGDDTAEATRSFDNLTDITTLVPMFRSTGSMKLDNLKIESYAVTAKQFIAENTVLNKSVNSLTLADTEAVTAAYNAYNKFDSNVKTVLEKADVSKVVSAQKDAVDKLNAKIDADAYKQKYGEVLKIETSKMTDEDIALFGEAMSVYEKLSEYAKQNLAAEKALIDAKGDFVITNMAKFTPVDFEDSWFTEKYVKTDGTADYVFEDTEDGVNNYVTLGKESAVGVNQKYWTKGNKPANASASFRFEKGTGNLYFLYDEENGIGAGICFRSQDGGYFVKAVSSDNTIKFTPKDNDSKLATVVKEHGWVANESYRLGNWQRNMWTKVDATFDYTNWESKREVAVNYILTLYGYQHYTAESGYKELSEDTEIKQITLPAKKITYTFPEGTGLTLSPKIISQNAGVDVDNITVSGTFNDSQDMGRLFEAKYSSLIGKTTEELTEADKLLLESALDDWNKLDSKAKDYLLNNGFAAKLSVLLSDNAETAAFKQKYASLGALDAVDARPSHSALVEQAVAEYNGLDDMTRLILSGFYEHILELKEAINNYFEPRKEGDYTTHFTDDFSSGSLKQWAKFTKDTNKITGTENFEVVTDPTDPTNKVMKVSANGGFITIRDELWANGGVMTNVSFRMKVTSSTLEGNAFNRTSFMPSFLDVNNYTSIGYNATGTMVAASTIQDGANNGGSGWMGSLDHEALTASDWITVTINYNGISGSISFTDEHENKLSAIFGMPLEYGRLAFGFGPSTWKSFDYYVDDVDVAFKKGDYDVNVAPNDIQVFYSGNTEMNPGDMVTVTGENIGKTVSGVEIMQLDNTLNASEASYIGEQSFQSKAAEGGAQPTWNDAQAQTLEIKQKTATSVKFIIPKTFRKGVYAVKLKAANKGQISNMTGLTVDDVIIYINNPHIQFTVSDEGKIATQGGWIRAQGSNLALVQDITKLSAVITNGTYKRTLGITEIYDDEYSVKIAVPKDVPYGKYNLVVYNGYGDNTAWSEPFEVTVGASPRDSWSKTVFNVQDEKYGAKGDSTTNDTASIISALIDAAENGGGVVYLPRGIYRVTNTLTIPENVVFKGEGINRTKIMYTPTAWMMGDAPDAYVQYTSNVSIEGIAFYGVRHKSIFRGFANKTFSGLQKMSENVYIKDVYLHLQELTGATTSGDGTPIKDSGYTTVEMANDIQAETRKVNGRNTAYLDMGRVENGQLSDFTLWMDIGCNQGVNGDWRFSRFEGSDFYSWCPCASTQALIVENCRNPENGGGLALSGEIYVKNVAFKGSNRNNHEVTTTDGTHLLDGGVMQFIGDNAAIMGSANVDEVTYRLKDKNYQSGQLVGYDVYVISGQGVGQTRRIVENKGSDIKVDKPFAVRPNRNSLIAIQKARSNGYFIDNSYESGGAAGTYGSIINTVFDGNTYKEFGGQIFNTHEGVNWYTSIVNATLDDPFYMHGQGLGNTAQGQTDWGHWQFMLMHGLRPLSSMAFLFKGNTLNDGSYMSVMGNQNYCRDFVIENNYFGADAKYGIEFGNADGSDGVYLRGNTYDSDECYNTSLVNRISSEQYVNVVNNFRYMSEEDYKRTGGTDMGDVNGDGRITVKDVTLIRYCILGKVELTDRQIARADMDGDGEITTNDANLLRKKILGL